MHNLNYDIQALNARAREILAEFERTKDRILYELSNVDKCTLAKLREIIAHYEAIANSVNSKLNILSATQESFIKNSQEWLKGVEDELNTLREFVEEYRGVIDSYDETFARLPSNLETIVSAGNERTAYVDAATDYQYGSLIHIFKFRPHALRVWPMNGEPTSTLSSAKLRDRAFADKGKYNVMCNGGLNGIYRFIETFNTYTEADVPYYCVLALNGMKFIPNLALTLTVTDLENYLNSEWLYAQFSGGGALAETPDPNSASILPVFGPLVVNGEIFDIKEITESGYDNGGITHFNEVLPKHPRQILGMDADNNYYIISAMGRTFYNEGLTYEESAQVCMSYGLVNAVMLDGGGSVAVYIDADPQFPCNDDSQQFGRNNRSCVQFEV